MAQDQATRDKITAYRAEEAATRAAGYPPTHDAFGLYPELGWHTIAGSRHLLAASCITAAAQAFRLAVLSNLPPTRLRDQAMCRLVEAHALALNALAMLSAGEAR